MAAAFCNQDLGVFSLCETDIVRNEGGSLAVCIKGQRRFDISVSISHGGKFAFAGISKICAIGVDVEPVSEKCVMLQNEFASSREMEILFRADNAGCEAVEATRLFSAKEAAAKCFLTHMYFAFHHYCLQSADKDVLIFEDLSGQRKRFSVHTAVEESHVFSKSVEM
jgi:4'-phosphopantetheinyl transferase EntD